VQEFIFYRYVIDTRFIIQIHNSIMHRASDNAELTCITHCYMLPLL